MATPEQVMITSALPHWIGFANTFTVFGAAFVLAVVCESMAAFAMLVRRPLTGPSVQETPLSSTVADGDGKAQKMSAFFIVAGVFAGLAFQMHGPLSIVPGVVLSALGIAGAWLGSWLSQRYIWKTLPFGPLLKWVAIGNMVIVAFFGLCLKTAPLLSSAVPQNEGMQTYINLAIDGGSSVYGLLRMAQYKFDRLKYKQAEELYSHAAKLEPDEALVHFDWATAAAAAGDCQQASLAMARADHLVEKGQLPPRNQAEVRGFVGACLQDTPVSH